MENSELAVFVQVYVFFVLSTMTRVDQYLHQAVSAVSYTIRPRVGIFTTYLCALR